jgi:AraC family transcriptional regulator
MPHASTLTTAGGLHLELAHVPADHRMRGHGHEHLHLCAVLDGAFREQSRAGGGDEMCAPGTVRLSPPEARHDLAFGPAGTVCLLVHAPAEVVPADAGVGARRDVFLRDDGHLAAVARALGRRLARDEGSGAAATDAAAELAVDGYAFELLAQCARRLGVRGAPGAPPAWLRRARELLHDRLTAPPGLAELAREAGVHRAHLARAFRDHYGLTPGDYVRVARAERARALIVRTRAPLSRVALEVGFADQSHMTRALRRAYGASPGLLRAGAR